MPRVLVASLLLPALAAAAEPADESHRDALARYGVGRLRARNDLPVQAIKQFEAAAKADPAASEPLKELARLYADVGRDHAAVRAAKQALQKDPDDADTAHALGKLLYDGKQFAEAAKYLRQAADSPRVADRPAKRFGLLRDLARAGAAGGDWPAAEAALRAADRLLTDRRDVLAKTPAFPDPADLDREQAAVREKLGEALAAQKKPAEAATAFRSAHEQFTKAGDRVSAARLDWNLSGVLLAEGKDAEALAHLERFLALKPSGPVPYERFAELLRRTDQSYTIRERLTKLADADPGNESIRWVMATEVGKSDPDAGDRLFAELLEKATDPRFFRRLVRHYKDRGQYAQLLATADRLFRAARPPENDQNPRPEPPPADPVATERAQAFVAAVKAEPDLSGALIRHAVNDARRAPARSTDTWDLLTALAERDGQLGAAETFLRHALPVGRGIGPGRQPVRQDLRFRLLEVLAKERKWEALKDLAGEFAAPPGRGVRDPSFEVYRAIAHAELGEDREALAAMTAVLSVVDSPWSRNRSAQVLNILGRHREAVAECLAGLAKAATPAEARYLRVALSTAYLGLKDFARAETELRAILDNDPDDVLALNNLGYNLADQGRKLPEAEELVRHALEVDRADRLKRGDPEAESGVYLDSLGWVLFRRGKLAEAREVLERASRLPDAASDAVVWDHLGDVCFRLGDRPAARKAWEKAAELYTGSHQGRQQGRLDEVRRKLKQTQ